MAPQLAANPLTWTNGDPVPTTFFNTTCKLRHIEFDGYSAAADAITLTDIDGKGSILLQGDVDLAQVRTGNIGWMHGLKLTVASLATTGKVSVFFE
jgi:hypothetical protein